VANGLKKSPTIYENSKAISQVTAMPRNSKSSESFKPKLAPRLNQSNESLLMRQQQQVQQSHANSYHVANAPLGAAASKLDDLKLLNQRNRSLMLDLTGYADSGSQSTSESKSSRFQMVKDKLLRKPSSPPVRF
jgi:hypothetical protein